MARAIHRSPAEPFAKGPLPLVIALAMLADTGCAKIENFKEGVGSLKAIAMFVEALGFDTPISTDILSREGEEFFKKSFDTLKGNEIRLRLLSPASQKTKYLGLAGKDVALGNGRITRDIKMQASSESDGIDFEAAYVVQLQLTGQPGQAWKVDSARTISADPTLANTSNIFKVYYVFLFVSAYLMLNSLLLLLGNKTLVDPKQMRMLGQSGAASAVWMFVIFLLTQSWFVAFFPRVFMSHFGFYWGLASCTLVMRQVLLAYNGRHFDGEMFGGQFLSWLLGAVPLAVFFLFPAKFAPEQASKMEMTFSGPPTVEVTEAVSLRSMPSESSPEVGSARPGMRLGYLGLHGGADNGFHRVVFEESTIAFLPAKSAKITPNQRSFGKESEFTTELVLALGPVERHKDADTPTLVSIGEIYRQEGLRLARRASIRDHLEALSRYNEALKYTDREEVHLAKCASLLEVVRLMRRDNLLNAFGLFQSAAVSYNKTKALAVYAIAYLRSHVKREANASDREALIALAHQFGNDDLKEASKHLERVSDLKRPFARLAQAFAQTDSSRSLPLWEEVVRQDPDSSNTFTQMGSALLQLGQSDRARLAFSHATALGPDNTEARTGLAAAWAAEGNKDYALKMIEEARGLSGYNSEAKVLGFTASSGRLLLGIALGCILFLLIARKMEVMTDSVLGTVIRVLANGTVFATVLVICWYMLVRKENADSASLQNIVKAFIF
jgi:tetratricopeptide (TPR) repeat protein